METTWHVKIPRAEVLKDKRGKHYIVSRISIDVVNISFEQILIPDMKTAPITKKENTKNY